jgi:hypothetical protein
MRSKPLSVERSSFYCTLSFASLLFRMYKEDGLVLLPSSQQLFIFDVEFTKTFLTAADATHDRDQACRFGLEASGAHGHAVSMVSIRPSDSYQALNGPNLIGETTLNVVEPGDHRGITASERSDFTSGRFTQEIARLRQFRSSGDIQRSNLSHGHASSVMQSRARHKS